MELYNLRGPLYWKLNPSFNGDRILSYGGYLRYTTLTINPVPSTSFNQLLLSSSSSPSSSSSSLNNRYPSVILRGNNLELHHYDLIINDNLNNDRHEVRLHESLWRNAVNTNTNVPGGNGVVTRKLLMIVLQNVESIYVKATDYGRFDRLM